jgi:hypothetical protein
MNWDQLSQVTSQAAAPAFLLGAVSGFVTILITRMNGIIDRIRSLNAIADDDPTRAHLKADRTRGSACRAGPAAAGAYPLD